MAEHVRVGDVIEYDPPVVPEFYVHHLGFSLDALCTAVGGRELAEASIDMDRRPARRRRLGDEGSRQEGPSFVIDGVDLSPPFYSGEPTPLSADPEATLITVNPLIARDGVGGPGPQGGPNG